MANKLILYVLLALALVLSVSAVGNVDILESSVAFSVSPGSANGTAINVRNLGAVTLSNVLINVTNLATDSDFPPVQVISSGSIMILSSPVSIGPGLTSQVALSLMNVGATQKAGNYFGTVTAFYNDTNKDTVPLVVTILPDPHFTAAATSPSVIQGNTGFVTVNITNTGNSNINGISYSLSALSYSSSTLDTASSKTGTIGVAYGSSGALTFQYNVLSTQASGTYVGTLNLTLNGTTTTVPISVNVVTANKHVSYSNVTNPRIVVNRYLSSVISMTQGSFNLVNDGNVALSGITLATSNFVGASANISGSAIAVNKNGFSLAVNEQTPITLSPLGIPASTPSGTYTGSILVTYASLTVTLPVSIVVSDAVASISMPDVTYSSSTSNTNVSQQVTISNNGDFALNTVTLSTDTSSTVITGAVPSVLNTGASFTVTLTTLIPKSVDTGVRKVGNLIFRSNELNKTSSIYTNVASKLQFDSVKISINDGSWQSVDDGEKFSDNIRPGSTFSVKVKLENMFTSSDDIDMEDVGVTNAVFYGAGEDGDDITGESDTVNVRAGKTSEELTIDWDEDTIDLQADSGNLNMLIEAEGTDDNGATHKASYNFSVEIERKSDSDFAISSFDVPSTVTCGRPFNIDIVGDSIGEDSDDQVVFKLESSSLGINEQEKFSMGSYNDDTDCNAMDDAAGDDGTCSQFEFSKSYTAPASISPGTYTIIARVYRNDGSTQTDEQRQDVQVVCYGNEDNTDTTSSTSTTSSTTSTTTKPATTTQPTSTQGATTSSVEVFYGTTQPTQSHKGVVASRPTRLSSTTSGSSFTDSPAYLALLSLLGVIVIVGIIAVIAYGASKPKQ